MGGGSKPGLMREFVQGVAKWSEVGVPHPLPFQRNKSPKPFRVQQVDDLAERVAALERPDRSGDAEARTPSAGA